MSTRAVVVLASVLMCAHVLGMPEQYASTVVPAAPAYDIPADLAGVAHLEKARDLTPVRREKLAELGFVVIPDRV